MGAIYQVQVLSGEGSSSRNLRVPQDSAPGLFGQHSLDFLNCSWYMAGEVLATVFRNQTVILKAEADAPLLAVDADVYAEDHTRL